MVFPAKPERNAEIARLYDARVPLKEISRRMGISIHRCREIAWDNGARPRYRTRCALEIVNSRLADCGL
jgi:hypothetical protein